VVSRVAKVSKTAVHTSSVGSQRNYELMLVIKPDSTEEKISATMDAIKVYIADLGGFVTEIKPLGKRKLAYPIKHCTEGFYQIVLFKMTSTRSKDLETRLNISEEIIRYLLKSLG